MDRLNREYAEILAGEGNPSEYFWALEKRIREDKHHPGVQLQLKRSELLYTSAILLNDGVIMLNDLHDFSDDLITSLNMLLHL